jgi:ankyrin repeat protein
MHAICSAVTSSSLHVLLTGFHYLAEALPTLAPAAVLIANGADAMATNAELETPMHMLAKQWPFRHGRWHGNTAFDSSADNTAAMQAVFDSAGAACLTARSSSGDTPLHVAVTDICCLKRVQLLIDLGADVNATNSSGETPLHLATDLQCAKLLIDAGADVHASAVEDLTDLGGTATPLQEAAYTAELQRCQLLLQHNGGVKMSASELLSTAVCLSVAPSE